MLYLGLGALVLLFLVWGSRRPVLKRREWRFVTAAFSIVAFAGAAWLGIRGGWGSAIVLAVVGLWLATSSRRSGAPASAPSHRREPMTASEARSILGVEEGASEAQVKAAYTRLMRRAHPDQGGTTGLATQLNAARDRLLGK